MAPLTPKITTKKKSQSVRPLSATAGTGAGALAGAPVSTGAGTLLGYLLAWAGVAVTTALIHAVPGAEQVSNISLLYLLVVIASAYRLGSGPSFASALLGVLAVNWFFVQPHHTLSVGSPADWLTLGIFLVTALVINRLTQSLQGRVSDARQREREADALAQASWAVASQVSHHQALREVLRQVTGVIDSQEAAILVRNPSQPSSHPSGGVEVVAAYSDGSNADASLADAAGASFLEEPEMASLVEDVLEHGHGAASLRDSAGDCGGWLGNLANPACIPLMAEQRVLGVLFLRKRGGQAFVAQERRIVESLANHASVALERHRLMQAQAQVEALGEADKLKTALLSMVSHDFRSPLAAIKTSVTGLLQGDQDDLPWEPWDQGAQHELLAGIDQETDRLNRMVGDILALSRLEADAWRPQVELVSATEIVGAALDSFSAQENARIRVHIAQGVGEVALDSVQIVQVLHNMIENALKYSPPQSPVELQVEMQAEAPSLQVLGDETTHVDAHGDTHVPTLRIEVLDRGHGLPPGEEERIFERFYRAARWREGALPGSGIGLAICRGLAEAHGGQIQARNRPGGGAIFSLVLPVRSSQDSSSGERA